MSHFSEEKYLILCILIKINAIFRNVDCSINLCIIILIIFLFQEMDHCHYSKK